MLRFSSSCTMSVESRFFNIPRIIDWPFEVEHLDAILLLSKAPDLRYGDVIPMPTRLIQHVGPLAFLVPISVESQTLRRHWWAEPYGSIGAWDGDRQCGSEPTLIHSDAIGLVCRPYLDRLYPPHLESGQKLLGCSCHPEWVGWTCPVCARVASAAAVGWASPTNWYQGPMWATGAGRWGNRGIWETAGEWDWPLGRCNAGGSWARFGGGGWADGGGGGTSSGWDWGNGRNWSNRRNRTEKFT